MRFGVPRSESPSPVRHRSTYGIHSSVLMSDEDDTSGSESDITTSSNDWIPHNTSGVISRSQIQAMANDPSASARPPLSVQERHFIEDTIASIRLHTHHHDPYEEWEKRTRRDAFRSARKEQALSISARQANISVSQSRATAAQEASFQADMNSVNDLLSSLKLKHEREEADLVARWKERSKKMWEKIEGAIKFEEEKVRVKLEKERKLKEEEEKKRKAEELKRRIAEEKRKAEEERKKKEEEEEQKRRVAEEEERKKAEEVERKKAEQLAKEAEERKALGMATAEEDWIGARSTLKKLKAGPIAAVKGNPELKKLANANRRKITPKIGQLTNDTQAINEISSFILQVFQQQLPPAIFLSLGSSLAKAILLQAETEVTAEKRSAYPLAQLTINLLSVFPPPFSEIFFARLLSRCGGWVIPIPSPPTPTFKDKDVDGMLWTANPKAKRKAQGMYREDEVNGSAEMVARVAGIMRVYFTMLVIDHPKPMAKVYQTGRLWAWLARLMGSPGLLTHPLAAELIYVALEVGGEKARDVWGQQWIKLMGLIYEGVTQGIAGTDKRIGGTSTEGKAAQIRVQLEIERIMFGRK